MKPGSTSISLCKYLQSNSVTFRRHRMLVYCNSGIYQHIQWIVTQSYALILDTNDTLRLRIKKFDREKIKC